VEGFVRKAKLDDAHPKLATVIAEISPFLLPIAAAAQAGESSRTCGGHRGRGHEGRSSPLPTSRRSGVRPRESEVTDPMVQETG
jgi:hypothetical protein